MAVSAPVVHTLLGTLTGAPARFYARHGHKARRRSTAAK
jgi:hypothetical protein